MMLALFFIACKANLLFNHNRRGGYISISGAQGHIHRGDTGLGDMVATKDILHHNDNAYYMSVNPKNDILRDKPNAADLHGQIHQAEEAALQAEINARAAAEEAAHNNAALQSAIALKKKQVVMHLKELGTKMSHMRTTSPEVLAKEAIPTAVFSEETMPLHHHMELLQNQINAVKRIQLRQLKAQKKLTRLSDITGKIASEAEDMPKGYSTFIQAAPVHDIEIPVTRENNGRFYISPRSGGATHPREKYTGSDPHHDNDYHSWHPNDIHLWDMHSGSAWKPSSHTH